MLRGTSILMGVTLLCAVAADGASQDLSQDIPLTYINLHLGNPPESAFACAPTDLPDEALSCDMLVVNDTFPPSIVHPSGHVVVWVLMSGIGKSHPELDGIAGVAFGISYGSALAGASWSLCTGGETYPSGSWPESGSAAAVLWANNCYHVTANADGMTKVGFFTIGSGPTAPAEMRIIGHPSYYGGAAWATCDAIEVRFYAPTLGRCSWGLGTGYTWCGVMIPTPLRRSSWGEVKSLYAH